MYEIELKKSLQYKDTYYYTSKNEKGQILHIEFWEEQLANNNFYWVEFRIGKRKEGYKYLESTGKDGLKSLLWAKNCIKDFIKYIENKEFIYPTDKTAKHIIVVHWDDSKRREAYFRGLKSLRFYYGVCYKKKCLMYKIK